MKLFVQADDYGMTTGVTDGIVASGRDGVLTQTGLFTNMPSTEYAVRRCHGSTIKNDDTACEGAFQSNNTLSIQATMLILSEIECDIVNVNLLIS